MKAKLISISLLALLMLGTAALTSCSKDNEEAAEPMPADFGIADYMIVGETFWGMNQSGTPPYIMTFDVGGKTTIYTLSGQSETTYTVEGNRVTLADLGYFEIDADTESVDDWLLVGALSQGRLLRKSEGNPLNGKTFAGQLMEWNINGADERINYNNYRLVIDNAEVNELYSYSVGPYVIPVNQTWSYSPVGNSGGQGQDGDLSFLFYLDTDGRLVFWRHRLGGYNYYSPQ